MPEAPGSLYTAGAGLLEAAGGQASNIARTNQDATNTTVQAGNAASSELGAERRQMSAQDAQLQIKKMEVAENQVEITPQLALGLVKNTGEKDWLKATGTRMRADVLMSLYTHGLAVNQAKRSPKVIQKANADGTVQNGLVWEDADGVQQFWPGTGIKPEKLHPPRGAGAGAGSKDTSISNADKKFMASQEKDASFFGDASKSEQLKATNPDEWNRRHDTYMQNQDRYDQLRKGLGKAGAAPAAAGGGAAPVNSAPFDADAFIKDALGQ